MESINDWMRFKRTITIAAIVVALCGCTCGVAGCSERAAAQDEENEEQYRFVVASDQLFNSLFSSASIFTDTETGCQYLFVYRSGSAGLTLLVDADGKPMLDGRYAKDGE